MKVRQGSVKPGAQLGPVLQEIARMLAADDWMRCGTDDGSSVYYIVGVKAHSDDQGGGADHMSLSIPCAAPVSTLGEHQAHGQVNFPLERGTRIAPVPPAWKARVLPLYEPRRGSPSSVADNGANPDKNPVIRTRSAAINTDVVRRNISQNRSSNPP